MVGVEGTEVWCLGWGGLVGFLVLGVGCGGCWGWWLNEGVLRRLGDIAAAGAERLSGVGMRLVLRGLGVGLKRK